MANEKTKAVNDERVEVFIPKGLANDDHNLYLCINGVKYLLPKGETSMVPPHVKAAIERSQRAQARYEKTSDSLVDKAKKPIN